MRKLVLILFCLITRPAIALDASVGTETTCSSWLQERDKLATFLHGIRGHPLGDMPKATFVPDAWLIGFLEGYDFACTRKKPLAAGIESEAVFERVDNICRTQSGDTLLIFVAWDLVEQLDPQHGELCGVPAAPPR